MPRRRRLRGDALRWAVALTGWLLAVACTGSDARVTGSPIEPSLTVASWDASTHRQALRASPLPAVPADPTNRVADDARAALLGRWLFHDTRFSEGETVSCATCHDPVRGFGDAQATAAGRGAVPRHTPSLWNTAHSRWWFWDGRADTLWSQAVQPWEHADEHDGDRLRFAHLVAEDRDLAPLYQEVFGPLPPLTERRRFPRFGRPRSVPGREGLHRSWERMSAEDQQAVNAVFVNLAKTVAAFMRTMESRNAPFDRFVAGLRDGNPDKLASLSASAQRGFALFTGRAGCVNCHSGPLFSDLEFHNTRVPPGPGGRVDDLGRFEGIPKLFADPFSGGGAFSDDPEAGAQKQRFLVRRAHNAGEFKTPSLRNVAVTAPYMHHGQFATLDEVLHYYSTLEGATDPPGLHHPGETVPQETLLQPLGLSQKETADLKAFLESLTDVPDDLTPWGPPERQALRDAVASPPTAHPVAE